MNQGSRAEALPIEELVRSQREFYETGATRDIRYRKNALARFKRIIKTRESEILRALKVDLGKSDFEAFTTEMVLILQEIGLMQRKLGSWAKDRKVFPGIFNLPGKGRVARDPHGVTLIMSPWNYPFMLSMAPVVGAIAGGNTLILKPSAYSPATSSIIASIISEAFDPRHVACVQGGRAVNQDLLSQRFDYIFFTGSVEVGKLVMESASKNLTPVTLELGGKSPCVVDKSADLSMSAKRIAWGKCVNAGQTCVAPDYILVHEDVKDEFVTHLRTWIAKFFGSDPHISEEFPSIVNQHHFERLSALIEGARANRAVTGGRTNPDARKIEPAIIDGVAWDDPIMQEELFGPIVPIITWNDENRIVEAIRSRPRPLAFYVFTRNAAQAKRLTGTLHFGGGCVNDVIMHVASHTVPFGGTGHSGMGAYHGKWSFTTFTREKSIIEKSFAADVPLRYAPFAGKYERYRKFLG